MHGVLAKGARAIVAITAGLGEAGAEGRAREDALIARIRDAGAVLVGPNCLGLVDNTTATYLSSNQFAPGSVAVLSQSGNLAIELDRLLVGARTGHISRFVSLGNQADVSLVELIEACAADPATVGDRRLRRGLPRRPRIRRGGRRRGRRRNAGRGAGRRCEHRRRPRRPVPHRLADQRCRRDRRGLRGRRRDPGAHSARTRRRAAGAAGDAPYAADRGSRC